MYALLRITITTLRLALPKVAVGWMFALLTIDFNRVAVVEYGVTAVIVTSLLSIHYFLAPFQVIAGRVADRFPLWGYRRTPYLLAAGTLASVLFLAIPSLVQRMGNGESGAFALAVLLFAAFGACMAVVADSYHSLIAENTPSERRPTVIAVVWIVMILSTILSAVVMNKVRPEFSPAAMQRLYNLTPWIVLGSLLLGLVGIERRLDAKAIDAARATARALSPPGNPLASAWRLLRRNVHAARFFLFISLAIFGLFLQESLIEVLGAEVFGKSVAETTKFQPIWGSGVLLGMVLTGAMCAVVRPSRHRVTLAGCTAAVAAFVVLAMVVAISSERLLLPSLFLLGLCAGVFNVGALSLMMDMTVEGATGLYMGLWGTAQAIGMGASSVAGGALHSAIIETGLLTPNIGYAAIFMFEATMLAAAASCLLRLRVHDFASTAAGPRAGDTNRLSDYVDALRPDTAPLTDKDRTSPQGAIDSATSTGPAASRGNTVQGEPG